MLMTLLSLTAHLHNVYVCVWGGGGKEASFNLSETNWLEISLDSLHPAAYAKAKEQAGWPFGSP